MNDIIPADTVDSEIVIALDLVNINTPDGDFGFIIGADGVFTDTNGKQWLGSELIQVSDLETVIGGVAPSGNITMSFFQDPLDDNLVGQIRSLGLDYLRDREITFHIQVLNSVAELYSPVIPPVQWMRRKIQTLRFSFSGAQNRMISLGFEGSTQNRKAARRLLLNTEGHAELTGSPNPSLEFMPTTDFKEESLFG